MSRAIELISGGCSFTFGNELSDDDGKRPSRKTWAHRLAQNLKFDYFCTAKGGYGNQAIARKVFEYVTTKKPKNKDAFVCVMWSFLSRYDWAFPRHAVLEDTRWASVSPWDTAARRKEVLDRISGSEPVVRDFKRRQADYREAGVGQFADSLYRYAANQYHEAYLSWKSIVWLQNLLEKKNIPYMFTLADNSLFWDKKTQLCDTDPLLKALHKEIDFNNWYFFGQLQMGFNQWATLNNYPRATTHPLDTAHEDALHLMCGKAKTTIDKWRDKNKKEQKND